MDRYLKGREPPIGVIQQLCVVYGVSADWLLGLPERGGSAAVDAPNNSGAIAVGRNARATVGGGAPPLPNCATCKYKKFSEAFKAIQTPD